MTYRYYFLTMRNPPSETHKNHRNFSHIHERRCSLRLRAQGFGRARHARPCIIVFASEQVIEHTGTGARTSGARRSRGREHAADSDAARRGKTVLPEGRLPRAFPLLQQKCARRCGCANPGNRPRAVRSRGRTHRACLFRRDADAGRAGNPVLLERSRPRDLRRDLRPRVRLRFRFREPELHPVPLRRPLV